MLNTPSSGPQSTAAPYGALLLDMLQGHWLDGSVDDTKSDDATMCGMKRTALRLRGAGEKRLIGDWEVDANNSGAILSSYSTILLLLDTKPGHQVSSFTSNISMVVRQVPYQYLY